MKPCLPSPPSIYFAFCDDTREGQESQLKPAPTAPAPATSARHPAGWRTVPPSPA
ncbi:MAG: hypothetical protein MUC60_00715 [Oscillatoria sp. Prado101]|nr:hypothetical protein [Oscillatoria sp. Prado101]